MALRSQKFFRSENADIAESAESAESGKRRAPSDLLQPAERYLICGTGSGHR